MTRQFKKRTAAANQGRHARRELLNAVTRRYILEAATRIISHDGLQKLTMDNIAAEAGMAKGTVYLHFMAKNILMEALKENSLSPLVSEVRTLLDGDLPPAEKIRLFVFQHMRYFDQRRDFFRVLVYDRDIAMLRLKRRQSSLFQTILKKVADVLHKGMHQRVFRKCDPLKVAAVLLEATIAMNQQRLCSDAPCLVEEDARLITDIFLNGLKYSPKVGS